MIIPISLDFDTPTDTSTFIIKFVATYQLFANGNDPVHLFRELADLGEYSVTTDTSELPDFDDLKWDDIHIKWEIRLTTAHDLSDISDVFEFVDGLCALSILRLEGEMAADAPQPTEIVQQTTASTEFAAPPPTDEDQKLHRATTEKISASPKASVRVDLDLVDKLINIVGELVINQAVLTQCIDDAGLPESSQTRASLNEFKTLARDIQENMMAIRAQSVKPLFQRMARIAREASDIAGKSVRFETLGETTEVDRTVIERLVDPLTHIIRNSVDHGVEDPARRREAGKPETGCITLSAAHRSGRVLIEVSDDGAGINRPKVLEIAISKGLISADAVLSDSEIDQLLFLPGFSTAKVVTNLSGRGVGMDVVRSAIQKLGGRVNISSQPGKGTTIAFSLPLTLAVLDGMVVNVAGQTMVVPITAIIETLRPKSEDIHLIGAEGYVVSIRNKLIPIIDLGQVFGHRKHVGRLSDMVLLLVESDRKQPWALAVDGIYDQRQVVIKSLENNYGHVPGVAAATILGDGKIALIIDPEEATERSRPQGQMRQLQGLEEV
jgi:two-component system chemotaxis sensor kinase CheA